MKIRIQGKGLKPAQVFEDVQAVVIYDNFDNPMYAAQQIDNGTIVHEKAGYKGFDKLLSSMGVGLNKVYKVVTFQ